MEKKVRRLLTKIVNQLNRPIIRNLSKFSARLLETMHLMKQRDPLTIAAASLSIADALADSFNLPQLSPMESFLSTLEVEHGYGHLPSLVFTSDFYKSVEKDIVFSSENEEVVELKIAKKHALYIVQYKNSVESYRSNTRDDVGMDFFYTKGLDFEDLFSQIWALYPYGIYLKRNKQAHTLELKSLPKSNPEYLGKHDLNKFCERLKKSRQEKISRSFLFHGPPGVGKTTAVLQIAYKHFKRIIKIDPAIARSLETGELEFFINQLRPEIVVFEDFDRAYNSVDMALFMLENIKQGYPEVIIFATVNSVSKLDPALLRPGRFDKMMFFGYPQPSEYESIINMYFDQYNPLVPSDLRKKISEMVIGLSPAYLKELAIESRNFSEEAFESELIDTVNEYQTRITREKKAFATTEDADLEEDFEEEPEDDPSESEEMSVEEKISFLKQMKDSMTNQEWDDSKDHILESMGEGLTASQIEDI